MKKMEREKVFKIYLGLNEVVKIFALSSGVFLFGGYLYNKIFLLHFNINASLFFSLSDYLTASLDMVGLAILTVIFAIAGIFTRLNKLTHKTEKSILQELNNKEGKFSKNAIISISVGMIVTYVSLYFYPQLNPNPLSYYPVLYYSTIFWTIMLLDYFLPSLCGRFFNNPISAFFIIFFTLQFVICVSVSAFTAAYKFENKNSSLFYSKKIKIIGKDINESAQLRVILANSSYFFMLSDNNREMIVYPIRKIQFIEIKE